MPSFFVLIATYYAYMTQTLCKVCTKSQGIRNKIQRIVIVGLVDIETGGPTSDPFETLQPYLNFENLLAMFDFTSRILLPRILVIQVPYS